MRFGDWQVDQDEVNWVGEPTSYRIPVENLFEQGQGDRAKKYDWLMHMADKTWVTRTDLDQLVNAMRYVAGQKGMQLEETMLNDTMEAIIRENPDLA